MDFSNSNDIKKILVNLEFEVLSQDSNTDFYSMILMLDSKSKLISNQHLVFYNNLTSPDKSVKLLNNKTIKINLEKIQTDVKEILILFTADPDKNDLTFKSVNNLSVKFSNFDSHKEIAYYKPENTPDFTSSSIVLLAKLTLNENKWEIEAVGDYFKITLDRFLDNYQEAQNPRSSENIAKYYQVLECTPNSSNEEIKLKYKELIKQFHPDNIYSKNLHKDFVELANRKFNEIKTAYDFLKQERGIN